MTPSPRRRVVIAILLSTLMVVLIAALVPRSYLANDDVGFTEYLRKNTFTPWISPILSQGFRSAYLHAANVPWWGLYQYALIIAIGAVLFHICTELIDRRGGLGQVVTLLGALVLGVSHAILVVGITWTTVSIAAIGTATAAFFAHCLLCQAAGTRASRVRSLVYGLLLVAGYMLRLQALGAVVVSLFPLAIWTAWKFGRKRYLPRVSAIVAFSAPFALVFALQGRVPGGWNDTPNFEDFTNVRGHLHGHAAFDNLDRRAPEVLAEAGWTLEEYRDFANWLLIDEADYTVEKMQRLVSTGGAPETINLAWSYRQIRNMIDDSAASVFLFLISVAVGVVLSIFGVIDRRGGLVFCLFYFGLMVAVPLGMAAYFRFPQRVSLTMFTVAALGIFVYLARELAERRPGPEILPGPRPPVMAALSVIGVLLFGWGFHLVKWLDRPPPPNRAALKALDDRVAARGGFVFVYVQAGVIDFDPLRARPRAYDGLQGGWGTFSTPWYATIKERLGVQRGSEVLGAMINNPTAYLLSIAIGRDALQDWIRRKTKNQSVRLSIVDGAEYLGGGRPELYRLVTTPLTRDSEEWRMMERDEATIVAALPGPPSVSDWKFRSIAGTPPAEPKASPLDHSDAHVTIAAIAQGLRATVNGNTSGCMVTDPDGHHAGISAPVSGMRAARFAIKLLHPENIISLIVVGTTATSRTVRWRWELSPQAHEAGFAGTMTLVPGYSAHQLRLVNYGAKAADVRALHISIGVMPGKQAGFELRNLEVAEP